MTSIKLFCNYKPDKIERPLLSIVQSRKAEKTLPSKRRKQSSPPSKSFSQILYIDWRSAGNADCKPYSGAPVAAIAVDIVDAAVIAVETAAVVDSGKRTAAGAAAARQTAAVSGAAELDLSAVDFSGAARR